MMAAPHTVAPTPSLVVRREKRRRRTGASSDYGRRSRRGFVFGESAEAKKNDKGGDAPAKRSKKSLRASADADADATAFVFRVRKEDEEGESGKTYTLNAATASAALRAKQEKAARAEMRRRRRQKKREAAEREQQNEQLMRDHKLSADQIALYHMVHKQARREMHTARREFKDSVARHDIVLLTETGLLALKQELISFMATYAPGRVPVETVSPENVRGRALIKSYEQRIQSMEEEEQKWLEIKAKIEAERDSASGVYANGDEVVGDSQSQGLSQGKEQQCELEVTQGVEALQRSAVQQLSATTRQLSLLDSSMLTVDRLIVEAEMKKARLFGAFHDSAFKGYANLAHPKENLRALLKLRPAP